MKILHELDVGLGARSYKIRIGQGMLADIAKALPFGLKGRTLFVLTDENVKNPHGAAVCDALKSCGARGVQMLAIPAGEGSKTMAMLECVMSWMLDHGADRRSVLFAVGGGVVGDIGGLAAALVMRGILYVQVPTTLLAQVDSSVGGKTAVNMPQGKNMVGAFHQPAAVICDLDTLQTLPRREFLSGYAEIVKYGLIDDPEFFVWLERDGGDVCVRKPDALARAVATSCRKKAEIVEQDEKEQGVRALLNLGHTFGHALESAAGYDGRLLHGEAVAIGMVLAFRLSHRLGLCPEKDASRVLKVLADAGLPVSIGMISPALAAGAKEIVGFMKRDKKAAGGEIVFVLASGIGKAHVRAGVPGSDVEAVIAHSIDGGG